MSALCRRNSEEFAPEHEGFHMTVLSRAVLHNSMDVGACAHAQLQCGV